MKFARWLGALLLVASLQTAWAPKGAAEEPSHLGARIAQLHERLIYGLRVRLPRDRQFIDYVVALVQAGKLPQSLVDSTYHWVRKRHWYERSLVPYFEYALRFRAKKLGIKL